LFYCKKVGKIRVKVSYNKANVGSVGEKDEDGENKYCSSFVCKNTFYKSRN
jgi:hypothetical protein